MAFHAAPFPCLASCLGLLLCIGTGRAQSGLPEARPDTLELPARDGKAPPNAAKTVLIPTDEDRLMGNLGDLLERMAGMHVTRTGQLGDYLGVSIRGSSERQVNVYVNGILQNPGADPTLFLGDWDLSRVERIEVYKGLAPEDLAGSPMGGAVNIITRETGKGAGANAALGAGSFGSLRANIGADARGHGMRMHAQASRNQADGDFIYYDDGGSELMPGRDPNGLHRRTEDDLIRKRRRNNAHAFTEFDLAVSGNPSDASELGIQADYSRLHKQIPAPYSSVDSTVTITAFRESGRLSTRAFGRWAWPGLELSGDLAAGYQGDIYVDTSLAGGAIGLGYDNDGNDYSDATASLSARKILTERLTVSALASYGVTGYLFTDRLNNRAYPWLFRYTGEGKVTPTYVLGRHTLQAMFAATVYLEEEDGRATNADRGWGNRHSARLGYQCRLGEGIWLSAQGGTAYRIPNFFERFGDRGSLLANPSLRSESGLNASLGLRMEARRASFDIQAFANEGKRIITLTQNSQFVMVYRNSGDTRVIGLETGAMVAPFPWTRTEADLTLQQALNLAGGTRTDNYKLIPYRPLTQGSLRQAFLLGGWTLSAYAVYQGLTQPNSTNQPSLFDSYSHNTDWQSRFDLTLSYRFRHLLAAAAVRNLFDSRNFDFFNFPLPGRSYAASLQTDF